MNSPRSTQKLTDTVDPKNEFLRHEEIKTYFSQRTKSRDIILEYAVNSIQRTNTCAFSLDYAETSDSNPTSIIAEPATSHGLASAIIHAYTLHQHLRISPDDVWLTIAQGVSKHICNNAERFRNLFVEHKEQEEIFIDARDIIDVNFMGDWQQAISRLSDSLDKRVKKVGLKQLLECDFSTSTNVSVTVSKIILLDAMKKYFRYRLVGGCGIPKITLNGTLEDWLHLQDKVAKLRDLGLELDFWLDRLQPVVAQFVATYKGEVEENFWSVAIYQVPYGSFTEARWDGWISALFPYNASRCKLTENFIFPTDLPSGLLNVPFNLDMVNMGKRFRFCIAAGFLGARQDKIDDEYVVSPVIGWYIV
ncbi:13980_t:CDS:1 [Funneliformis geosporum]|uniref:18734_t:CDS:1 n=1 Tax=Funneliformis geosporum TaxID=1117311 RepID=A0A9W4SRW8_9GLOM|nr:13980_t:CDS:1 [Funneliformis geosporum]CAI2179023.1 18734_t:CDS:1 [Funneliformis geosporum]